MAAPKRKRLPARLYFSVMNDVERDQRKALIECLEIGMPTMVERYGHHSNELRGLEDLVAKLRHKR